MIHFWTDIRPGEPDILTPLKDATLLIITTLDGASLHMSSPPEDGWTHDRLRARAKSLAVLTSDGANAYLGPTLVGSTET
ncbi:MAG: hypothetical protein OYH76_01720 [Defluviicoccus sp.]|nr:hypothetical protein [Defluviicoccus sp.]MDE0274583.1 hypothetical protein [Defluviicoccus sp.]